MKTKIKDLHFGGAVLRDETQLPRVVHEIYKHWREGSRVAVTVSNEAHRRALYTAVERAGIYLTNSEDEAQNAVTIRVGAVESDSVILENDGFAKSPTRVALLGCGTVGGGVFRKLAALPEFFQIVGVAERDYEKARSVGVPEHLLTANAADLIAQDADAVIELFGGTSAAHEYIKQSLNLRRQVVTANKALLSVEADNLENSAAKNRTRIRYGAAVGGAIPALETISSIKNLRSFSGIVNGTCNFICDELGAGVDFPAAVQAAQTAGFAENDPTLDLSGADAAQKLILLARAAFGKTLSLASIERAGIENLDAAHVRKAAQHGLVTRLIIECRQNSDGAITASVKPVELPAAHPFAQTKGAENCLRLEIETGEIRFLRGTGAGRTATSEAVLADLFDVRRDLKNASKPFFAAVSAAANSTFAEVQI